MPSLAGLETIGAIIRVASAGHSFEKFTKTPVGHHCDMHEQFARLGEKPNYTLSPKSAVVLLNRDVWSAALALSQTFDHYVLLWIVNWLPGMQRVTDYQKMRVIGGVYKTARQLLAKRKNE